MPLVTITVRSGTPRDTKTTVLDAVHAALVAVGVPPTDLFQRVVELGPDDFRYDPGYPDLSTPRDERFVLIEILWSVGRSVKIKRQLLQVLMQALRAGGIETEHAMVVFKETAWENWAFGGGRQIHA